MYSTSSPLKGKIHSQLFLVVLQSLNRVLLFVSSWTAARQASLSFTISWSLLKLMSIESVMPSNHLILCHPLLLPPSIFPSIRVFSNESALHIRWPKWYIINIQCVFTNIHGWRRMLHLKTFRKRNRMILHNNTFHQKFFKKSFISANCSTEILDFHLVHRILSYLKISFMLVCMCECPVVFDSMQLHGL